MRFSEYLIEGNTRVGFAPEEIKALQQLAERSERDFTLETPMMVDISPEQYNDDDPVHTSITKEPYRKERGKFMYRIEETVSGEDDEYSGNSYSTIDFADLMKRLAELLD